jgi:hypothetical protein
MYFFLLSVNIGIYTEKLFKFCFLVPLGIRQLTDKKDEEMPVFCPVRDKTNQGIRMFYRPVFPTEKI